MPLKLSAGISKKVGLPNYSSLGASCQVELELEAGLLERDLEALHRQVRSAYVACSQAVSDELARQAAARQAAEGPTKTAAASASHHANGGNGRAAGGNGSPQRSGGNGRRAARPTADDAASGDARAAEPGDAADDADDGGAHDQPASARQIDFLRLLAGQIRGLGLRRLEAFCEAAAGKPVAGLSARDASMLIDRLKRVRGGQVELAAVFEGAGQ